MTPEQEQTVPSLGQVGMSAGRAASPTVRMVMPGKPLPIRAKPSRGARPRVTATVSQEMCRSLPWSSRTTTAETFVSPSKRTISPVTVSAAMPASGAPTATTRPNARPATASCWAALAVTIPASWLPGATGCSSAAPVATMISLRG